MFTDHFYLVPRLRMNEVITLRPIYVSMACTTKTLPNLPLLLTYVVHATSNIRTFTRQIALLCSHRCLIPALFPNVSKHYTSCPLILSAASRLKQVLPFISPTFPQSLGLWSQVWVTNCNCRSRGKWVWTILGNGLLLHTSLICHNTVTTQQCHNTLLPQQNTATTQECHNTTLSQHNSVTTQQCHNTTTSQLKICDFSGETFKGFEVL